MLGALTARLLIIPTVFNQHSVFQNDIKDKYAVILHTFAHEIEDIKRLYQKFRDDPMIARDMPPIAGKIMWSRQLFRKIEEPMNVFLENAPDLLKVCPRLTVSSFFRSST